MAKAKKKVNKSQAVRDELSKSRSGSPSEVVSTLAKRGIKVSPAFVSNIKSQQKKSRDDALTQEIDFVTAISSRGEKKTSVSGGELQAAKALVENAVDLVMVAGVKQAHDLIDLADKLIRKISIRK